MPTAIRHATERLRRYHRLRALHGASHARELMVREETANQAATLGPLLGADTLATGFARAVPILASLGLVVDFVDVSTGDEDAALELMITCTCLRAAEELGAAEREPVLCDVELAAACRALPVLSAQVLARQTDGRPCCVFRYARRRDANPGVASDPAVDGTHSDQGRGDHDE
ncbi:hypothetical protein [Streptoalloteichus hindustanus]|uniref:hypothetical protein n=1 Tax=Streptoalloteichus hindustanus TaxID=2017 RepID=UPI000935B43C|nr:hypothetical protein [Streptoalloteichus hindustanus]